MTEIACGDQNLFSEHVCSSSFQEEFKRHWSSQDDFKCPKFEIISKPFKICRIPNFLKNEEFLENLKDELTKYDFNRLHTDLYQFERTDDLVNMTGDYIPALYKSFHSVLTSWMERNTNIELNGKISMSSARYHETHHLLCHDDNMGDRRIAYILYLSKDWTEQDGGTLDLFDMDQRGAPGKVVKSLIPEYNSLVFFEVVNNSYHQVDEVTAHAKCRWSINGWFHGPIKNDRHRQPRYEIARNLQEPKSTEVKLNSWITERYLLPKVTKQIQRDVEKMSYAFLEDFLKGPMYQQIAKDLASQDISWQMMGPADMRHYEVADEKTLPQSLMQFCDLFKSISFFQLLKKYTGLDLVPEHATECSGNSNTRSPKMRLELQRWSAGCYTLLYDKTLLEDGTDEADADITDADASDVSINSDNEFLPGTVHLDDAAAPTSVNDRMIRGEMHQQLKRKRIECTSEKSSSDKKKIAKTCESRPSQDTRSDEHKVESASGSSLHKSKAIGCDAKVDITITDNASGEDEGGATAVCDYDNDSSSDDEDSVSTREGYDLDVIMQFHTVNAQGASKTKDTIDYVNPCEEQGIIVEVPQKDNHLCLAYKSPVVCRLQHYLNHFYEGYTYTLLCMYYE